MRAIVWAAGMWAACGARGQGVNASPEELQYFRHLLMTIGGADYGSEAIAKTEASLVYQFGVDAREADAVHTIGQRLSKVLQDARRAPEDAGRLREKGIADAANQILGALRPEIAARMRMPGKITAKAVGAARTNPTVIPSGTPIDNLTDFQSCLSNGWNQAHKVNYGNVCQLTAGVYHVPCDAGSPGCGSGGITGALTVRRSGTQNSPLWVLGTVISGVGDTVLQRSSKAVKNIMVVRQGATYVDIDNLTFDGNRYAGCASASSCGPGDGIGLNCLLSAKDNMFVDLNAGNGGVVTVQYVNFINAPWIAVILGGPGSTLSYSNVGFGSAGEPAPQSAARATAIFLMGSSSGVYYSNIYYAGGAAINMYQGTAQTVYGNTMDQNQYELAYAGCQYKGCPPGGGQLFIDPATNKAIVAANIVNGNNYRTSANPEPINGCQVAANQSSLGMEIYGSGHSFYNNWVLQNVSAGMTLGGSSPTNDITISGLNPFDPNDTPRYIQYNRWGGFRFLGPKDCGGGCKYTSTGVTLSHLRMNNNRAYSVYLDAVSGPGFWEAKPWAGHNNDACIYDNQTGDVCAYSLSEPKCASGNRGFPAGQQTIHNVARGARCPAGY